MALGGVVISVALCYAVYGLTHYDLTGRPVAVWAPFLVPLAVGIPLARPIVALVVRLSLLTDGLRETEERLVQESHTRRSVEEKLRNAAITDDLTNVYNRRHFFDLLRSEIARAVRYARPLSVAILDVDHFKHVNDRFGHAAGDSALRAVVETCRPLAEHAITIARYGGEEFVLLFPEADELAAVTRSNDLRLAIASTSVRVHNEEIRLTASFGVASLTRADETADRLLARADSALYRAKRAGRNRVDVATA
ncbi:MAG: GGDEF domain-containing protein [Deltaproteobacteria bacterium]|nr:GGDEF domain-containing protein [Deltaproteobacteria bacterium]